MREGAHVQRARVKRILLDKRMLRGYAASTL